MYTWAIHGYNQAHSFSKYLDTYNKVIQRGEMQFRLALPLHSNACKSCFSHYHCTAMRATVVSRTTTAQQCLQQLSLALPLHSNACNSCLSHYHWTAMWCGRCSCKTLQLLQNNAPEDNNQTHLYSVTFPSEVTRMCLSYHLRSSQLAAAPNLQWNT